MSRMYQHNLAVAEAPLSTVPPVFRGYDALSIEITDLAKMIDQSSEHLESWKNGVESIPDSWRIFLTEVLGRLIEGGGPGMESDGVVMARNWLELAQENIKDMPRQAYEGARRIAYGIR